MRIAHYSVLGQFFSYAFTFGWNMLIISLSCFDSKNPIDFVDIIPTAYINGKFNLMRLKDCKHHQEFVKWQQKRWKSLVLIHKKPPAFKYLHPYSYPHSTTALNTHQLHLTQRQQHSRGVASFSSKVEDNPEMNDITHFWDPPWQFREVNGTHLNGLQAAPGKHKGNKVFNLST